MRYAICNETLPLTVYREVAAHLSQVDGVTTTLTPQSSTEFDYSKSQIGELWIEGDDSAQAQVEKILAYYSDRFGAWTRK
jgi:hypothetical protein